MPLGRPLNVLADLVAENLNVLVECECGRFTEVSPYTLDGSVWKSEPSPTMADKTIDATLAKLKCRSCGGRVEAWWPKRRGA